jgi:TRAP-type uncharacterized transport system fused permease subunit
VTDPQGVGLLLNMLPGMGWMDVVEQVLFATLGLAALSSACQGFAITAMKALERWLMAVAGLLMVFPAILEAMVADAIPAPHWVGFALAGVLLGLQYARRGRMRTA